MGQNQSTPPPPPSKKLLLPTALTKRPWRDTRGWSREIRRELKDHVAGLAPETCGNLEVPFFNILLTGQIGAGKSRFYNSLRSVFLQRDAVRAEVGVKANSLTNKYRVYEMRVAPDIPPLSFRICDTVELDNEVANEIDVRNILKAVDGHVPDGFVFDREREIVSDTPGYINTPSLQDKAHCVAVVINAKTRVVMREAMWRKLRSLRSGLIDRKVPTFILLTHIEEACPEVNNDLTKVYHSITIRDLVTKVGKSLHGLLDNQIFPVVNYVDQIELNDNMNILLLTALRQMLYSAQGYLENKMSLG